MMVIEEAFELGELVYLKTDPEQYLRVITGIIVRPGTLLYYLSCEGEETIHYNIEITREKNTLLKVTS